MNKNSPLPPCLQFALMLNNTCNDDGDGDDYDMFDIPFDISSEKYTPEKCLGRYQVWFVIRKTLENNEI